MGFLMMRNARPMNTPPVQPWLNTDSINSVLTQEKNGTRTKISSL